MPSILDIDQMLLLWINSHHSPCMDSFMWLVSGRLTWLPLYVLLAGLMFRRWGWKYTLLLLLAIALAVGASDFVSSGIIKPWVARLRPTHSPELQNLLHVIHNYRGGLYGFVSSHAANTMACALLFSLVYRKKRTTTLLMLWVALVVYSRMYLGVHYPLDILGGLAVGALMAWLTYLLVRQLAERWGLPEFDRGSGLDVGKWISLLDLDHTGDDADPFGPAGS